MAIENVENNPQYTLMTFIGTGQRHETIYKWGEKTASTEHFAEALLQFFPINKVLLFVTPKAKASTNFEFAQNMLKARKTAYEVVDIPNGSQPEEYWQIFDALTQHTTQGEQLIFDITHGFRSLPMLGFLACVYLKALQKSDIAYLLYGNYEALRDSADGHAPVYDLTPFLSLLDWIEAANQLTDTGSSYRLAKLMTQIQSQAYRNRTKENRDTMPQELGRAAKILETISASLLLSQPEELHSHMKGLHEKLPAVQAESQTWAKPVAGLLQHIEDTYSPFQGNDLGTQRDLIYWYLERGHYVQAITLGREWLVSYMCKQILDNPFPDKAQRRLIERAIGYWNLPEKAREEMTDPLTEETIKAKETPDFERFLKYWSSISEIRNTVAHCGMGRDENSKTLRLQQSIGKALEKLKIFDV